MYGRIIYGDQRVFINNSELLGVTSFNGNFEIPTQYNRVLGSIYGSDEKNGPDNRKITINKYLTPNDALRSLTGANPCSGILIYKNKNYSFNSGYISNYSLSCAVGEISMVQADFEIYGNMGGGITATPQNLNNQDLNLNVSHFGNINIQTSEGTTNRIVSFDLSIDCPRIPIYTLGSNNASDVSLNRPLEINLIIGVEIDDYECNDIQSILCGSNKDITLELNNCDNTTIMESFTIPDARLVSENLDSSTSNATKVELTYKSYIY